MNKIPKVGLIGFGCVGQGFYRICQTTPDLPFELVAVCDRNTKVHRDGVPFFTHADKILENPDIDIVVEAINSSETSCQMATKALESGKNFVTANKKMVSENIGYLIDLQKRTGKSIWFEAAVGGAIPIIYTLDSHFSNLKITGLKGILNGTCNYILTQMFEHGIGYEAALAGAQAKGFAESDPTLDVEGYDAKNKLVILLLMTYGIVVRPQEIFNYGINHLSGKEIAFFKEKGMTIRLLVHGIQNLRGQVRAYVMPTLLDGSHFFANICNEDNVLEINGLDSSKVTLCGKGAGSLPTGSAVFSDVIRASKSESYSLTKFWKGGCELDNTFAIKVLISSNSPEVFEQIDFQGGVQCYYFADKYMAIGHIGLQQLMSSRDLLNSAGCFVADLTYTGPFDYHLSLTRVDKTVVVF